MKTIEWSAAVAAVLALFGWLQTVARFAARLGRAEKDIRDLSAKLDTAAPKETVRDDLASIAKDIGGINKRLDEMDRRRETARGEIGGFRERISRELGEIRAMLNRPD